MAINWNDLFFGKNPGKRRVVQAGLIAPLAAPIVTILLTLIWNYKDNEKFFMDLTTQNIFEYIIGFIMISLPYAYGLTWLVGIPICLIFAWGNFAGFFPVVFIGFMCGLYLRLFIFEGREGVLMIACSVVVSSAAWLIAFRTDKAKNSELVIS